MVVSCLGQRSGCFVVFRRDAANLFVRQSQAGCGGGGLVAQAGQARTRPFQPLFALPPRLPRLIFRDIGGSSGSFGSRSRLPRGGGFLFGCGELRP